MSSRKKAQNVQLLNSQSIKREAQEDEMRFSMPLYLQENSQFKQSKRKPNLNTWMKEDERIRKMNGRLCRGQDGRFRRYQAGMSPLQDDQGHQSTMPVLRKHKPKLEQQLTKRQCFQCMCVLTVSVSFMAILVLSLISTQLGANKQKPTNPTPSSIPEIPTESAILPIFRQQLKVNSMSYPQQVGKIDLSLFRVDMVDLRNISHWHWYRFIDELHNEPNITWVRKQENTYITLRE